MRKFFGSKNLEGSGFMMGSVTLNFTMQKRSTRRRKNKIIEFRNDDVEWRGSMQLCVW